MDRVRDRCLSRARAACDAEDEWTLHAAVVSEDVTIGDDPFSQGFLKKPERSRSSADSISRERRAFVRLVGAITALLACQEAEVGDPNSTPSNVAACRFAGSELDEPTTDVPGPECVTIGSVNPLSGALGAVGFALENAARLAVADVNAAGGLPGARKLCLVTCDTRTDPSTVRETVTGVVAQFDIVALNGAAASASSLEAAQATKAAQIAQVSCCSTSPALTERPEVYRTVPSDALQGVVLANLARTLSVPAEQGSDHLRERRLR